MKLHASPSWLPIPDGVTNSDLKTVKFGDNIPKVIHQTYSLPTLSAALQDNIILLEKLNPEWEVRFYDNIAIDAYIATNFGREVHDIYQRIHPSYGAARADLFRYLLIYNEGGCYLDIKSSMIRPLDSVLRSDDRYIVSQWNNKPGDKYEGWGRLVDINYIDGGEYQQWHLVAAAGHPLLRLILLQVLQNIKAYRPEVVGVGALGTWRLAGPIPYTIVMDRSRAHFPHRKVNCEKDLGFVYNIFHDLGRIDEYNRDGHHRAFQKAHYSQLTDPLVYLGWWRTLVWFLVRAKRQISSLIRAEIGI